MPAAHHPHSKTVVVYTEGQERHMQRHTHAGWILTLITERHTHASWILTLMRHTHRGMHTHTRRHTHASWVEHLRDASTKLLAGKDTVVAAAHHHHITTVARERESENVHENRS